MNNNTKLNNLFDRSLNRVELNMIPAIGTLSKLNNSFQYRFTVSTGDLSSYQRYYEDNRYIGCIYDFTDEEKDELKELSNINFVNANAFYIPPHTLIHPHLDYSPKRSLKSTIIDLSGNNILRLYDNQGNIVYESIASNQYTIYPCKVIHSYNTGQHGAKLINTWHE